MLSVLCKCLITLHCLLVTAMQWKTCALRSPRHEHAEFSNLVCLFATHRQKHKEESLKLKQELASLRTASKGGQQGQDRSKKELDMAKWVHTCT